MEFIENLEEALAPVWQFCVLYFSNPIIWSLIGLIVLVIVWFRFARARRPIVLQRSQGGNLEIARTTLRGLIIGASELIEGVDRATCKYDQKGSKLRVTVAIHLAGQARLPLVEEELKKAIRTTLQQHVGYEPSKVTPINVRVTKISGDTITIEPPREEEVQASLPRFDSDDSEELPEGQATTTERL
jgi:uncharacterized alkaline shock family protein YloU|tara:strand:- start:7393 stop:7953 length:561 start_codon:yes stop_codon:yes gene_type:complete